MQYGGRRAPSERDALARRPTERPQAAAHAGLTPLAARHAPFRRGRQRPLRRLGGLLRRIRLEPRLAAPDRRPGFGRAPGTGEERC